MKMTYISFCSPAVMECYTVSWIGSRRFHLPRRLATWRSLVRHWCTYTSITSFTETSNQRIYCLITTIISNSPTLADRCMTRAIDARHHVEHHNTSHRRLSIVKHMTWARTCDVLAFFVMNCLLDKRRLSVNRMIRFTKRFTQCSILFLTLFHPKHVIWLLVCSYVTAHNACRFIAY